MRDPELQDAPRLLAIVGEDVAAAQQILRSLRVDADVAVVVAMPVDGGLIPALAGASALPVQEVAATSQLTRGRVHVVRFDHEVTLAGDQLVIEPRSQQGCIDRMLRSFADMAGSRMTVVVLRGHDGDGALGIRRVREAGGVTICQRTAYGDPLGELPQMAIATGRVDLVLPVDEIAARVAITSDPDIAGANDAAARTDDTLRDILAMIRIRTGHDFTWYKRATLYRRLARRMQVCQTETLADYQRVLREQPTELGNLLRDFLISVTNFFRDPEVFAALADVAIPRMFRGKQQSEQVRVWVAGCASGEEAYSIGMLLAEYAARQLDPPQLQVFATDIDEEALAEARAGFYPEQIATDVSAERLQRFFLRENGGYRVSKDLREMMLFSPHNVLRDPPFSRLDLISCRNMLIYLNRDAQERVLNTFHFALRNEGLLLLGSSESAEAQQQFSAIDVKNRLFERRIAPTVTIADSVVTASRWLSSRSAYPLAANERTQIGSFGELHHRAVEQYAPPSVLVNEDLDIVHLSEHASRFLTIAGGEPTRQILRLVHPALRFELRGALYAARQSQSSAADTRVVRFEDGGQLRVVELRVRVVDIPEAGRGTMLVTFDELDRPRDLAPGSDAGTPQIEPVVREMEDELHRTRDQLRTTVEQYETSLEELKASNEELQAINEELRSATEELETSKEELQSVNEELTTLNHELKLKVDELSRSNSDLQNLMTSTDIGVLFLDRQLNIKRFTPRVQNLFNVIPSDIGRPLAHLTHRLDYVDLRQAAAQVLVDLRMTDREVQSTDGRRFLVRLLPYRSVDDRIDGVVLTFVDVDDLENAQEGQRRATAALRTSEERLALALSSAPLAVITHDHTLVATWAFALGRLAPDAARAPHTLFSSAQHERYAAIVREVYETGHAQRAELDVETPAGVRTFDFRIEPARSGQLVTGVNAVGFDITPSKQALIDAHETDRRKDEFLAMLSHELRNPLTPLKVAFDVAQLASRDPAHLEPALKIIGHQIDVLVRLVDDLLDLSRIAQGKMQLVHTRLDPLRIVEAALETARPLIDEHHHTLEVELPKYPVAVIGDHTRLTQVVTNLLNNAAKYTPNGGTIRLVVSADLQRRRIEVSVADSGIGIAPEMVDNIFDLFVQAKDAEGRRHGGLGVGLTLVRRIVELHGGSVSAKSDGLGRGSTFTFALPLAPPEKP